MTAAPSLRLVEERVSVSAFQLTGAFHSLNRLLPIDQKVFTVSPDMKASEALRLMDSHGFSQLPVCEGNEVLGVFSYRSYAIQSLNIPAGRTSASDLPVEELMEIASSQKFAHLNDGVESVFDRLERFDSVLIGHPGQLQGILTVMDVLRYLYGATSAFVFISEIELGLRGLIHEAVDAEGLRGCALASLTNYAPDKVPTSLEEMTFNDYVQIIGDGRNWPRFQPIVGGTREMTRARLVDIRDLRNDVFHFRSRSPEEDQQKLAAYREWILMKARAADARRAGVGRAD